MQSDFNSYSAAYQYLDENMKDQKQKNILANIYEKYGPLYLLSAVTKNGDVISSETPIKDLDYDTYKIPNLLTIKDYDSSLGTVTQGIFDDLRNNMWTSIRFDLDWPNLSSYCRMIWDYASSYRLTFSRDYTQYSDSVNHITDYLEDSSGPITPIIKDHTVQINIGITDVNKVLFEMYFGDIFQGLWILNDELNDSVSMLKNGNFYFIISGTNTSVCTISFEEPIIQCVSNTFLYEFGINL